MWSCSRKVSSLKSKSLLIDPIDKMAWDTEDLPWPGLMVQFAPIDDLTQNVEALSVSRCPRMESSQGLENGPPVEVLADEALSPGKVNRSDSQLVSEDWNVIAEESRRCAVKHGWTPRVLGSSVAGKRQLHKRSPKAEATILGPVKWTFVVKGTYLKQDLLQRLPLS
ncbi:hypothetical protein AAFF_G00245780 [Aldrovandia affinis]|uniref:Uncharacterized protein n=1 Tax=Aldrovandia affinis TaxID=143900 RepID=A0AAD7SUB1_9TELE|nr:hypothetical protein AAFF_G00245780 [Aldrovandia affinis]